MNRFRTSWTQKEGVDTPHIIQCKVVNVNLVNWTVDVISQFDRKQYYEIQVSSSYLHYSNGEGMYAVPDVGASCMVCLPSDSSPPFVLTFIMPFTSVNSGTTDAPQGTSSNKGDTSAYATDASFDGGRMLPKQGDICLRGRDGNFVTLHRGGVLQIGASELSQRLFIPLGNLITDVSQNYTHLNSAGTISWGLQQGPATETIPTKYLHTFRVFANDAAADVRITAGDVTVPIGEPADPDGDQQDLDNLEIGNDQKNSPIVYEVAVAPKGFNATTGEAASLDTIKQTVLRFFFDRKGATFLRCKGSLLIATKKKLKIKASETIEIEGTSVSLTLTGGADINGGSYAHIKGDVVRLGSGGQAVARQGDVVTVVIPPGLIPITGTSATGGAVTGFIMGGSLPGTITSGNPAILA